MRGYSGVIPESTVIVIEYLIPVTNMAIKKGSVYLSGTQSGSAEYLDMGK